jgi:cyclic pyranopterin monophosphate synthase
VKQKTDFTHFDALGRPQMVDVSDKPATDRIAVAEAIVTMAESTRAAIEEKAVKKGDVLAIAELAGIMAAKRTSELIPLCHPIPLSKVTVQCEWVDSVQPGKARLKITATVKTTHQTGVEMEALTACTVAGLTVYDMCKAIDRGMEIGTVRLVFKDGGKSGRYVADEAAVPESEQA